MSNAPSRNHPGGQSGPLLFVLGLISGLLFALFTDFLMLRGRAPDDLVLLGQVHDLAMADFVSEVNSRDLMDDALAGMLEGLDSHSRFYPSREIESVTRETTGEFRGIGVIFRQPIEEWQLLFAFPGGPAARAGLKVGDRLLKVQGTPVDEFEPGGVHEALRSKDSSKIEVLVKRLDGTRHRFGVVPEHVTDPTVRHARIIDAEQGIGYVALHSFTHRTADEFDAAMLELRGLGVRRLVIDLRFNPGGILDSAVKIANRFIESGTLVSRETRHDLVHTLADPEKAIFADMSLVLLVNGGSASASEVLAGALQDHGVATLVGVPTYGKGTVQTLQKLAKNRGMLKFTTAKYYTPSHRSIERVEDDRSSSGIAPDYIVEISSEERIELRRYLARYSPPLTLLDEIHAWEQYAGLELLSPSPEDAQLEAAIALLHGLAPDAERQEAGFDER